MPSFELPLWQRAATAVLIIAAAWFARESNSLYATVGESTVRLTAGAAAISVILGMKLPLGLWRRRIERRDFAWVPAMLVAALGSLIVVLAGKAGPAISEWSLDKGGVVAFVLGASAWSIAIGKARLSALWKWMLGAGIVGLMPGALVLAGVRITDWTALSVDGGVLFRMVAFLSIVEIGRMLVTDELAFRRLLVGRSREVGLIMVIIGAFVYGIWSTFTGSASSGVLIPFATGMARGLIAGAFFVLSRSLLVPAVFSGVFAAFTMAGSRSMVAGGTGAGQIEEFLFWIAIVTAFLATIMMIMVFRKRGAGQLGEFEIDDNAAYS